jgi:hypothetical protein
MEAQAFSEAYTKALYKTPTLTFTLTDKPTQTILFNNKPYSIITAHNPYSQKLSKEENEQRHKQLETILQECGLEHDLSTGESPDGSWREEGFIIFDISLDDALELGRHFEQHAIVYGQGNRVALAWCEDGRLEWYYVEVKSRKLKVKSVERWHKRNALLLFTHCFLLDDFLQRLERHIRSAQN